MKNEYEIRKEVAGWLEIKRAVHISKKNREFNNGIIIKADPQKEFFVIDDEVDGPTPIYYEMVHDIRVRKIKVINSQKGGNLNKD